MTRLLGMMLFLALAAPLTLAQEAPSAGESPSREPRGSLVEDRAAAKLIEAGDGRFEAEEFAKAVEVWESVIERYPRSRARFVAHMRLGNYLLDRERQFDKARQHFEAASSEDNTDEAVRAEATLKMGICFYEARNYGKCFAVMRDVIEQFPVSPQVNEAYYYIGLGHFQSGHYSRAIDALEKVGTTLSEATGQLEKVEAGKRLFVHVDDADLAAVAAGETIKIEAATTSGDKETLECHPVGRNVRIALGSMLTVLGKPQPGNGQLEIHGGDKITVTYVDAHTGDKQFNKPVLKELPVVSTAVVQIVDGAFNETLQGVVLDKPVNLQVIDADFDLADSADQIKTVVEIYRENKVDEEAAETAETPETPPQRTLIDRVELVFDEARIERKLPTLAKADEEMPAEDGEEAATVEPQPTTDAGLVHSGVFRTSAKLAKAEEAVAGDDTLQARPGDILKITYLDERHAGAEPRTIFAEAKVIEGNLGGVRVTRAQISDQELRIQTQLKTASALTNIGNRYKEFGLKKNAASKYEQALRNCEEIMHDAQKLGGRVLEETYVQLWHIYYEMDRLELAGAMCRQLQKEFPNSSFVDDALLQMADVVRKQGDLRRAVSLYSQLVAMNESQLRGEAQYGIAECYEEMAKRSEGVTAAQLFDRAFVEFKKVYDDFPDSGRVGEAVAKMANFYYQQKDYARAIDIFETVLSDHPDARFLDVILFNYGRCLYRMDRKAEARQQFDQLIAEFPESPLATDAKKVAEALSQAGF